MFYLHDEEDYLTNDNDAYFRLSEYQTGIITRNEKELLSAIQAIRHGIDDYASVRHQHIDRFHRFLDGESSTRVHAVIEGLRS